MSTIPVLEEDPHRVGRRIDREGANGLWLVIFVLTCGRRVGDVGRGDGSGRREAVGGEAAGDSGRIAEKSAVGETEFVAGAERGTVVWSGGNSVVWPNVTSPRIAAATRITATIPAKRPKAGKKRREGRRFFRLKITGPPFRFRRDFSAGSRLGLDAASGQNRGNLSGVGYFGDCFRPLFTDGKEKKTSAEMD